MEILGCFLANGTATPVDVAAVLRLPLGTVSYHVRFLAQRGILRLTGHTQRRGVSVHHYQLADRGRAASLLWGLRARLLVSDFERENGRGDLTAALDADAIAELEPLTSIYIARIGELGLQTRERQASAEGSPRFPLTRVAVLLATDEDHSLQSSLSP
ncbi:MAG: winged helix-turn-helix domain-containing protein [Actinobacteria bacterium]|nr:winged helix-turn-helix domain-containing protein [Actinomycetota bacterium]